MPNDGTPDAPMFSRSSLGGKKSSDVKARITDETKFALQKRCAELGITESDYIDRLLCVSLFGIEQVIKAEKTKTEGIVGKLQSMWNKPGTTD